MGTNNQSAFGGRILRTRSLPRLRSASRFAAVAVMAAGFALQSADPASADEWYAGARDACAASMYKMRCYHEVTRRLAGLSGLRRSIRLHRAASVKNDRIVACGQLSHEPCGDSLLRPFYQTVYLPGSDAWRVGENLAWGWPTAWAAFNALMQSAPHRENILTPSFREIGIEVRHSPWGRLWVIHFGRRW
jgi:uncharacterized protein YkwD